MSYAGSPQIITDGLIFCLDADNIKSYVSGSEEWVNIAKSQYTGSIVGTPTLENGGLTFLVGEKYLTNIPVSYVDRTISFCSFCDIDTVAGDASTANRLLSLDASSGGTKYCLGVNNVSRLQVAGAGGGEGEPTFAVTASQTFFVGFVVNTSTYDLYLNGERVLNNEPFSPNAASFGNISIAGRPNTTDRTWQGTVYIAHIYNRTLTLDEIKNNYNILKGRFGL